MVNNVEFLEWPELKPLVASHAVVGSRAIPGTDNQDADLDFLVLVPAAEFQKFVSAAANLGFRHENATEIIPGALLTSMRKGQVNLLVTNSQTFYQQWLNVTAIACKYKVVDREELRDLHGVALYGAFGWIARTLGGKAS